MDTVGALGCDRHDHITPVCYPAVSRSVLCLWTITQAILMEIRGDRVSTLIHCHSP